MASLKKAIENDEEAAKSFKQLAFTEGVINGRIAVVESEEETAKRAQAKKAANKAIMSMKNAEKAIQKRDFANYVKSISGKSRR